MKKLTIGFSVLVVICLLITMLPKVDLANDVTVESVTEQLEKIHTLQQMQDKRKEFTASSTYEEYLANMRKARKEAAEAYEALSKEDKESIDSELVEKLDNNLDTVLVKFSETVPAGDQEYQYYVAKYSYEVSNHKVTWDGGQSDTEPQTHMLVNTAENAGKTWTPNGKYSVGTSNYEVVYCSDFAVNIRDGYLYKRVNLEDSTYYDDKAAEHIRAIVSNSYPFISLEQMKANLAEANFEHAEQLTRGDIIAAVQMAIWKYSNGTESYADNFKYYRTFDLGSNTQWGPGYHNYTNELWNWWRVGENLLTLDKDAEERVNELAQYLVGLKAEKANANQIVINEVNIESFAPVQEKTDAYNVALKVRLNNGGTSKEDKIVITVKTASQTITKEVELGTAEYDMVIEAKAGETISVLVEGKQKLSKGVYLYEPKPADENDTTSRKASQVLVGVAEGLTAIRATDSVKLDISKTDSVTADLKLKKTDEKGAVLTGAAFDLYFIGEEEATYKIGNHPVDKNGVLNVEGLFPGDYKLVESVVPAGYLTPTKPIAFSIDEKGILTLAESTYAKFVDDVVGVKNYPIPIIPTTPVGSLSIKKVDSVSKETLEGATFTLKGKDFERILTTGKDGTLLFSELPYGEYTLTETEAPAGYMKDATEWPIKIGVGEGEQIAWVQEVANTPVGSLEITKTDSATGETLQGAEFRLTNQAGDVVGTFTTDENGKVTFENLLYGEYTLEETKAPAGYMKDATEWKIKIGIGEGEQRKWVQEVANTPVGLLEITKTDSATGKTLEGAEFRLTNQAGDVVGTGTTDKNGKVTFKNLPYGEYKLEETKVPAGYVLNKESEIIKITENDQIEKYEFTNKAITGSVKVVKQDDDGNPLAGAEFTLTQGEEIIGKAITNAEGIVEFTGLSYGVEYTVTETKAPEGYLLNNEATATFIILEDDQKEEFTYENTRENPGLAVEKTADKNEAIVGETVTYTIVATNTGNKALTNVVVKDNMIGLDTVIDQLAANESKAFTGKYVVTAGDIGELENTVTATVKVDDEPITQDDSVIVHVSTKAEPVVDETPTTIDKIVNWIQNPKTGDTTTNTLLLLFVFVLAGVGLYVYGRKRRG